MKKILYTLLALIMISCNNDTKHTDNTIIEETPTIICGDTISAENALNMEELAKLMNDTTQISLKVKSTIVSVCQVKGCWMDVKLSDETSMKVMFKDYAFFVPKDAAGKEAVMEGVAYMDTVTVVIKTCVCILGIL